MKKNENRNLYFDVLKGIAIILVIIGHNIQFGNGFAFYNNQLYYENILFKIIYTFHMPLFMLISGYFFAYSVKKYKFKELINKRFFKLLYQIICWTFISLVIMHITGNDKIYNIVSIIKYLLTNLWFLWAILYCSVIVIIVNKKFNDSIILYLLILILSILIPDILNIHLYKYVYPFFIIGYILCKFEIKNIITKYNKYNLFVVFLLFFIYLILLSFFNKYMYIYTSKISIFGTFGIYQIFIDIYRWVIGLVGVFLVMIIVYNLIKNIKMENKILKVLSYLGQSSLTLYILDDILNKHIILLLTYNFSFNYMLIIIETIIILVLCIIIKYIIQKTPLLKKILRVN